MAARDGLAKRYLDVVARRMGVGPEHLEETSCSPSDLSTLGRLVSELAHLNDEDWWTMRSA
jgi:hypothetical protein